jgi:hypothetical protein
MDRQPNSNFTRRSRYEAVRVGTSRGCGGSVAAWRHSGVLVIKFVDGRAERVRRLHVDRSISRSLNRSIDQR